MPKLSSIKVNEVPTMPLSDKEYERLLQQVPEEFQDSAKASKVHALIQLMKHSGLAITDSIMLERDKIEHDAKCYRIVTSRQKTGVHVSVPIPTTSPRRFWLSSMEIRDTSSGAPGMAKSRLQ